jgi:lactate dehydrogenase-like 2-hydroxyacid dehydrogenase
MGGGNAHVSDGGFSGDDRETIGDLHPSRSSKTKVLFCGLEFLEGWNQTRLAVEHAGLSDQIDVVRCDRQDVPREIQDAHVAVPLMTRLDATALQNANALRMVIQFGVGLEGVDEAACVASGIVLARIPSENTGNAASTAEMAVFLTLAAMREVWAMRESVYVSKTLGSPMGATLSGKKRPYYRLGIRRKDRRRDARAVRVLGERGETNNVGVAGYWLRRGRARARVSGEARRRSSDLRRRLRRCD